MDAALVDMAWEALRGAPPGAVILGYWPLKDEPDLRPLWERLRAAGMRVAFPRRGEDGGLTFHEAAEWPAETEGLWEPPESPPVTGKWAVVPGLGFTPGGGRLGAAAARMTVSFPASPAGRSRWRILANGRTTCRWIRTTSRSIWF